MKDSNSPSSTAPLKQAVNEHYQQQTLDAEAMARMQALLGSSEQTPAVAEEKTTHFMPWKHTLVASFCAFFILASSFFMLYHTAGSNRPDTIAAIAQEVAKNHLKMKPLEVSSDSFVEVRRYFTALDFSPTHSSYFTSSLHGEGVKMLGGRYCSIKGITAAQLRYQRVDHSGRSTLYETVYDKKVFGDMPVIEQGQQPIITTVKGLEVQMWVEKGLLMVAVSDLP